jgi:biotin carboxyl carrier protein
MEKNMSTRVLAPMVGRIVRIHVRVGDRVTPGAELMVLESMKLESPVTAPCEGFIEAIHVVDGSRIQERDVLAVIS